jgi:UDP:flavonoid glycosyltransferase YjiC (YdhE family)
VGTDGDVFPHLGLGRVLRARGHRATLAAPATYRARAAAAGLGFASLATAEEAGRILTDPDLWHPLKSGGRIARWAAPLMRRQYESLAGLAQAPGAVLVATKAAAHPGVRLCPALVRFRMARGPSSPDAGDGQQEGVSRLCHNRSPELGLQESPWGRRSAGMGTA